jgi:hypothetical protein
MFSVTPLYVRLSLNFMTERREASTEKKKEMDTEGK